MKSESSVSPCKSGGEAIRAVCGLVMLCLVLIGLSGCQNPRVKVAEQVDGLTESYLEDIGRIDSLEQKTLGWEEALELMVANNLELRRLQNDRLRAKEQVQRIFLDLLPSLNLNANVRKAITELSELDSNDLSFNIFSAVNVPGIIGLKQRHYTATLSQIRTDWSYELKIRELHARLYEDFISYENLQLRQINLEQDRLWAPGMGLESRLQASPESITREQELLNIKLEANALQERLADLLGSYEFRWQPDAASLPELNYRDQPLDITDPKNTGLLVRQIQALELEGQRLRIKGIKLSYWPDISFSFSSPPLYSYSGGTSSSWTVEDITVSAFIPLRIDTQLRTTYQLRDARRQEELTRARIRMEITRQVQQYRLAQEELNLLKRQLQVNAVRLEALQQSARASSLPEYRAQLENNILLTEQRANLQLQIARLETMFWMLDESRWKHIQDKWDGGVDE